MSSSNASPQEPDSLIIERSLSDPEAFGVVYTRHGKAIASFVAGRVAATRVEDVVADVFVTAFRKRRRYDTTRSSCLPWLCGIARNTLRNEYRWWQVQKRRVVYAAAAPPPVEPDIADTVVDRMEALHLLREMAPRIALLPDHQRKSLTLLADGHSYRQIADEMGCDIGTVRSRISRARAALTKAPP